MRINSRFGGIGPPSVVGKKQSSQISVSLPLPSVALSPLMLLLLIIHTKSLSFVYPLSYPLY
ncbi:MAG TPA: hypothetical protein VF242_12270 [Nitrososphaeraceae archaeon]